MAQFVRTTAVPVVDASFDAWATSILVDAVDDAVLAPSLHNTQPWTFRMHPAGHPRQLDVRVDRSRQLTAIDPTGRALVQSVGAALLNARVAIAAHGWAAATRRLPDPADPDLLAVVELTDGPADPALAELRSAVTARHTNRRTFGSEVPAPAEQQVLRAAATAEGAELLLISTDEERRLLARLSRVADGRQHQDPAYRAELRRWTNRPAVSGDGIVPAAVPRVDGAARDDLPGRDFDTRGDGQLPTSSGDGAEAVLLLLTTLDDDEASWLRSGEALQRVLLELTRAGWVASPLTQVLEDQQTRHALRTQLTWGRWPQSLLRVGHAPPTPPTPRRPRHEVVLGDLPDTASRP
jgi:nitroreductase